MTKSIELASDLRKEGINTEVYLNDKKLKAKFKYADKLKNSLCCCNWRRRNKF